MNDMSEDFATLAPYFGLLMAHAELIRETSGTMAMGLSDGLEALRAAVHAPQEAAAAEVDVVLANLLACLQAEDILRQQVVVLETGLQLVADAIVPAGENPAEWLSARFDAIKQAYVMQQQHDVHARVLNLPAETAPAAPDDDDIELF